MAYPLMIYHTYPCVSCGISFSYDPIVAGSLTQRVTMCSIRCLLAYRETNSRKEKIMYIHPEANKLPKEGHSIPFEEFTKIKGDYRRHIEQLWDEINKLKYRVEEQEIRIDRLFKELIDLSNG